MSRRFASWLLVAVFVVSLPIARPLYLAAEEKMVMLPMYWGYIGLTDAQKEQIYAIKRKSQAEEAKLEEEISQLRKAYLEKKKQLATIEANNKKEMLAVLTPDQVTRLGQVYVERTQGKSLAEIRAEAKGEQVVTPEDATAAPETPSDSE